MKVSIRTNGASSEAEASLDHIQDGSIVVQLFTSQPIPTIEAIQLVGISSTSTEWKLKPVRASISENGIPAGSSDYSLKARIPLADMSLPNVLSSAEVSVSFTLTGIPVSAPYFNGLTQPFTVDVTGYAFSFTAANRSEVSHVVSVTGITYGSVDDVTEKLQQICWLVSFATGSLCGMRSLEVYVGRDCVRRCLFDVTQLFETQPYVIPAEDMSQFLTTASPQFSRLSLAYNLPALIHLSLLAKREDITNVKALIMGNWLEILRYQFAYNVGVPNGYYKYHPNNDTFDDARTRRRATFQDILTAFTKSHNISGWTTDFKDLRNTVMHTGALNLPILDLIPQYKLLHHFCDRVILALLDWDKQTGRYIPYDNPVLMGPQQFGPNILTFVR